MKSLLKSMDEIIKGGDPSWEYPMDDLIPLLLKKTYDSQEQLKKSQDKLNFLTAVLVVCTIVLAVLTVLLYFKG
jgi:hypothetical protein